MEELERIIYLPQLFQKLISPNLIRADSSGQESQTTLYNKLVLKLSSARQPLELTCPNVGEDTSSITSLKAAVSVSDSTLFAPLTVLGTDNKIIVMNLCTIF